MVGGAVSTTLMPTPGPKWAELPCHVFDVTKRACVYCGTLAVDPEWPTYDAYVEWWMVNEYEGERNHFPDPEHEWVWLRSSCLRAPEDSDPLHLPPDLG